MENLIELIKKCNGEWGKKTYYWDYLGPGQYIRIDHYNDRIRHIHGTKNQFTNRNVDLGKSACSMISLYASVKFLNNMKLNEIFIDDAIEEGIDRYNDFLITPTGQMLKIAFGTETPHVNVDEIIASVFDWRNGRIYRHLKTTNSTHINQIDQNFSGSNFVCIVTIPPETYSIFFDKVNNYVYLFDSHGRSSIFNNWNDFNLVFDVSQENPYANSSSFILRGNTFDDILQFINKNGLPETPIGGFGGDQIICHYFTLEN